MVWQKRLNFGPTACFVPPCVPKSAKGKRSVRNKVVVCRQVVDEQLCAFDLLATVAGKLLQGGESSSFSDKTTDKLDSEYIINVIKKENLYDGSPIEYKACDPVYTHDSQNGVNSIKKEKLYDESSIEYKARDPVDTTHDVIVEPNARIDKIHKYEAVDGNINAKSNVNPCNLGYKMITQAKPHALASSDSVMHSNGGDQIIDHGFLPCCRDGKLLVNRDDDEKFSWTTYSNNHTLNRSLKYQVGQRRAKQHLAAKFWKAATTMTKGREFPITEMRNMPYLPRRKVCYGRQRSSSFMRRKYLHRYSVTTSHRGVDCEDKRILSTTNNGHLSSYGSEHFNGTLSFSWIISFLS